MKGWKGEGKDWRRDFRLLFDHSQWQVTLAPTNKLQPLQLSAFAEWPPFIFNITLTMYKSRFYIYSISLSNMTF
jgi:hypothetical protein